MISCQDSHTAAALALICLLPAKCYDRCEEKQLYRRPALQGVRDTDINRIEYGSEAPRQCNLEHEAAYYGHEGQVSMWVLGPGREAGGAVSTGRKYT